MKSALPLTLALTLALTLLTSCGSSKKFKATDQADKALFAAINELQKRPGNEKAQSDLKLLYQQSVERHENAIEAYKYSVEDARWDRILAEYNALQHIYNSMQAVPGTFSIVRPKSYLRDIEETKSGAAEEFYQKAVTYYQQSTTRDGFLEANALFRRSGQYVPGYKDIDRYIRESYERSIVTVLINPIEDDNLFFGGGGNWGYPDFRYRPQEFQDALVRDLGGRSASRVPARFYNEREIRRERIQPDWEVNLRWRSINPLVSTPQQYTRQVSRNVEVGRDTLNKPIYRTVYATLYINQVNYRLRGDIEYRIEDLVNRQTIDNGMVGDELNIQESSATYTGDSRALSQDDWALVNNRNNNNQLSRGQLLTDLLRRIYPDLRRRIEQRVH
jgi:hypothetical protein